MLTARTAVPLIWSQVEACGCPRTTSNRASLKSWLLGICSQSTATSQPRALSGACEWQAGRMTAQNPPPTLTNPSCSSQELFCVCGALKRARLVHPGVAEVVFVKKDDAITAYKKYNNRCLDGKSGRKQPPHLAAPHCSQQASGGSLPLRWLGGPPGALNPPGPPMY